MKLTTTYLTRNEVINNPQLLLNKFIVNYDCYDKQDILELYYVYKINEINKTFYVHKMEHWFSRLNGKTTGISFYTYHNPNNIESLCNLYHNNEDEDGFEIL